MLLCSARVQERECQAGDSMRAWLPRPPHTLVAPDDRERVSVYFNSAFNSFQGNNLRNQDVCADDGARSLRLRQSSQESPGRGAPGAGARLAAARSGRTQVTRGGGNPPALDPADICSADSCQHFFQLCAPLTFGSAKV